MASDLIEKLRAPTVFNPRGPNYEPFHLQPNDLALEAADALAALHPKTTAPAGPLQQGGPTT